MKKRLAVLIGVWLAPFGSGLAQDHSARELGIYCQAADGTRQGIAASQDGATLVYTHHPDAREELLRFVHSRRTVALWHAQLDAVGFDAMASLEPDADFCAISRTRAGDTHQVAWPRDAAPPAPIAALFEAIMNLT
ncbi:hypothetical protein [Devosia sp. A369]